jgi:hypothetical protein
MATIREATIQQSTNEIRRWTADFTDDLPTGGLVGGGTAIHTPPSGSAGTPTVTTTNTTVSATLGPLSVTGIHYLDIQATFSDGEKSEVRIAFAVNYPAVAARASMADLILTLRGLTACGIMDYTVADVPYWSDAQLQAVLDRHVSAVRHEDLFTRETIAAGGTVQYFDYQSPGRFYESTDGGTARFIIQDAAYATVAATAYSVDYPRGLVTFAANTLGMSRYLTGFSYDLNAAAADVWSQQAIMQPPTMCLRTITA